MIRSHRRVVIGSPPMYDCPMDTPDQAIDRILAQQLAMDELTQESLTSVRLYAENQGDKFHPLSDEILSTIDAHEQSVQDSRTNYEPGVDELPTIVAGENAELHAQLTGLLAVYAGDPESIHHFYHIGRLQDYLTLNDDED